MPAEVVREILGRHTVEAIHPLLQPAIIGIHVVDVIRPRRFFLGVRRNGPDLDAAISSDGPVGRGPIRHQNRILSELLGEAFGDVLALARGENLSERRRVRAISRH